MRQKHFNELSLTEKALLVNEFANFLYSIEFYDHRIYLYALNSHFIEVYYNIDGRQVEKITLANYKDLDKYLPRIVIGNLRSKK